MLSLLKIPLLLNPLTIAVFGINFRIDPDQTKPTSLCVKTLTFQVNTNIAIVNCRANNSCKDNPIKLTFIMICSASPLESK